MLQSLLNLTSDSRGKMVLSIRVPASRFSWITLTTKLNTSYKGWLTKLVAITMAALMEIQLWTNLTPSSTSRLKLTKPTLLHNWILKTAYTRVDSIYYTTAMNQHRIATIGHWIKPSLIQPNKQSSITFWRRMFSSVADSVCLYSRRRFCHRTCQLTVQVFLSSTSL